MATLEENINQVISDLDDIQAAIIEKGVSVPEGTDTREYGNLVRSIPQEGGGVVDQSYSPESANAQSGKAVAEALAGLPIKYVENLDSSNPMYLREFESGTYILYGKFKPFNGSTGTFTFSTGMLVSIQKTTDITYVQVFYSKSNTIQYLEITDEAYTRKDAKLINMESTANLTTTIDENSDDTHYPSAKAVYDSLEIKRIENLDKNNPIYFRDIESGYYIFHGYFRPYPNSASFITMDTMYCSVARLDEGSHLLTISPLNFRMRCYEILVDDTATDGFTYNSWQLNLLDLHENLNAKVTEINDTSDDEHYPSALAVKNYVDNSSGGGASVNPDEFVVLFNKKLETAVASNEPWGGESALYEYRHMWTADSDGNSHEYDGIYVRIYVPSQTEVTSGEIKIYVGQRQHSWWGSWVEDESQPYFGFGSFVASEKARWLAYDYDLREQSLSTSYADGKYINNNFLGINKGYCPAFPYAVRKNNWQYWRGVQVDLVSGSLPAGTEILIYARIRDDSKKLAIPKWGEY